MRVPLPGTPKRFPDRHPGVPGDEREKETVFENSVIAQAKKAPLSAKVFFALLIGAVVYIVIFG